MSELNCTNNRLASTSSANRKWKWSKSVRIAAVTVLSLFIVFLLYDIVSLNWEINKTNKLIRTLHGNGSSNQSVPVPAPISGLSQDLPKNCADVSKRQLPLPGVYVIHPPASSKLTVDCMRGGWTVIQSRGQFGNPKDFFYKPWTDYELGFGTPGKEFWAGLIAIYNLTKGRNMELRITMEKFDGETESAFYRTFYLGNEPKYTLHVGGFSGSGADNLDYHNGYAFSTYNRDQDADPERNDAKTFKGAWWYKAGFYSSLNGYNYGKEKRATELHTGIHWHNFAFDHTVLKSVQMAIRPIA